MVWGHWTPPVGRWVGCAMVSSGGHPAQVPKTRLAQGWRPCVVQPANCVVAGGGVTQVSSEQHPAPGAEVVGFTLLKTAMGSKLAVSNLTQFWAEVRIYFDRIHDKKNCRGQLRHYPLGFCACLPVFTPILNFDLCWHY